MTSWHPLALNPYGEHVAENERGERRVATTLGWKKEAAVAPVRVCRAHTAADVQVAQDSLAVAVISASYGHQAARAFQIWSTPPGTRTPTQPPLAADPRWQRFHRGVDRALGNAAWQALVNDHWGAPGLPRWDRVRNAPTGVATRGLQWGVAQRLLKRASTAQRILEMGLSEPGEAATRWLPPAQRLVRAREAAQDTRAPAWLPTTAWFTPVDPRAPRHMRAASAEPEPFDTIVLWATAAAVRAQGEVPAAWWRWLSEGGQGWVIFDVPNTPAEQALRHALVRAARPASRWRLVDEGREVAVVWEVGLEPAAGQRGQDVPWTTFAPEPAPGPRLTQDKVEVDEYGRVPYRALSRLPKIEGVAPRRLESAMHQALRRLGTRWPDVDVAIAEALGVALDDLGDRLSPEQVDAVATGLDALEGGHGFVVADEAGFGKGRIMAALALIGRRRGHQVLMLTENAPLFSDGYRDLDAVSGGQAPIPFLLHQDATLVNPDGQVIARNLPGGAFQKLLAAAPDQASPPFIVTTYSQVARNTPIKKAKAGTPAATKAAPKRTFTNPKLDWLTQWADRGTTWVLMDEAHNAAGDSQANLALGQLLQHAAGAIYASATFAKGEDNLDLYAAALPKGRFVRGLIRRVLRNDHGLLRETLTQAMARDGRLMRREHPPMAPPTVVWVPNEGAVRQATEAFADAWRALGEAVEMARPFVDEEEDEGVWAKLGGPLSRAVRELGLWSKIEPVAQAVIQAVRAGEKPVICTDSTLESGLVDALTGERDANGCAPSLETADEPNEAPTTPAQAPAAKKPRPPLRRSGEGAPPLWKDRLRQIVAVAVPDRIWQGLPINDTRGVALRLKVAEALTALDRLPDWTLSPLDALRERLEAAGIRCGELSGRSYRLEVTGNTWRLADRKDPSRLDQVRAFNAGDLDAQIISRAGSTGISLHAGRRFKDQRPRVLIELDVSPNPAHRWQFWGRVRRRDQVCEPTYWSFWLDTPSERRIIEREARKSRQLGAHMGAARQEPIGWVSPEGEAIVAEWAQENAGPARRLGVAWPFLGEPTGRVERALARSPMLTEAERAGLIQRLSRGLDLAQDYAWRQRQDPLTLPSREVRRRWWWGDPIGPSSDGAAQLGVRRVDAVERCWAPQRLPQVTEVQAAVQASAARDAGAAVLARWTQDWQQLSRRQPLAPSAKQAWQWANRHLSKLTAGQGIAFTSPETGAAVRGVVLDLDAPVSADTGLTPWALSQLAVRVWLVGDAQPLTVNALTLSEDPLFKVSDQPVAWEWFETPPAPRIGVVMEGNVLAATQWGQRWAVGRSAMVWDVREGEKVVWAMPSHVSWEDLLKLPRDLVDHTHAHQFLTSHPDGHLLAALPPHQMLRAVGLPGRLLLQFNAATLAWANDTWLDVHFRMETGASRPLASVQHPGLLEVSVEWPRVPKMLGMLENAGVGWRVPPEHLEWYRTSSMTRLYDPATSPQATRKGAGGQKRTGKGTGSGGRAR
jgi:hypothetical protein